MVTSGRSRTSDAMSHPPVSEGAYRYRGVFIVVEAVIAFGAIAGTVQLIAQKGTPPVSDLDSLGLTSWTLPGVWLFVSVAVPSGAAAWLAWRRSAHAPVWVLIASGALAVELLVQIPFIGLSRIPVRLWCGGSDDGSSRGTCPDWELLVGQDCVTESGRAEPDAFTEKLRRGDSGLQRARANHCHSLGC